MRFACLLFVIMLTGCVGMQQEESFLSELDSQPTSRDFQRNAVQLQRDQAPIGGSYREPARPLTRPIIQRGSGRFVGSLEASTSAVRTSFDGKKVRLNFVDVEIAEFVRVVFDEILELNYAIDADLSGRITVRTSRDLPKDAVFAVVRNVLENNGARISEVDDVYTIVPSGQAAGSGLGNTLGSTVRIIPLDHLGPEDAAATLEQFGDTGVQVAANTRGRFLLLRGSANDLDALEQVIATLDVDQLEGYSVALLPLDEAPAIEVASELGRLLNTNESGSNARVFAIERMNALLVIAINPKTIDWARRWSRSLDASNASARRIYVYAVQNRQASELADVLNGIFSDGENATRPSRDVAPGLDAVTLRSDGGEFGSSQAGTGIVETPSETSTLALRDSRGARITADESQNALVIYATRDEYDLIRQALRQLDTVPVQVLIEATIAEVKLTDDLKYGVRWFFESGDAEISFSDLEGGEIAATFPGFNYFLDVPKAKVALTALDSITDVEVISSPSLTVLDNQTARLQVGDQVPVATRASSSITDPDAPVVNDIELRDTGIILSVTPRISAGGLVVLSIAQEVSDVVATTTSGIDSPTIRQRRIESSVAVQGGTAIVLGGLISSSDERGRSGVPYVMEIPILGELFRTNRGLSDRTELIVILRPTVIRNDADVRYIAQELARKLELMR